MSKKNVILILTDQMRGDCLGVSGNNQIMTPFLDQLASDGLNFTNAHSANPSCIAARASILTGLPSEKTGYFGYRDGQEWTYKNTMVDELNERGYKTINVGKTHFYPQRNDMNFSINKLYDPQRLDKGFKSDYHQWLEAVNPTAEDPALKWDNNGWSVMEWMEKSYYHPTEWTMRTGIEEIENSKDEPFFLQLSFHRPHQPLDPPEFYKNLYRDVDLGEAVTGDWSQAHLDFTTVVNGLYGKIDDKYYRLLKEAYYALITHIDYQIGKLIKYLRLNNMYNDTLIMFSSDHGDMLGDHYMYRKATPFRGSVHIPMIVRGPGVPAGATDDIVTHIDIKPTILNYIDGNEREKYDGLNILGETKREALFGEHPFDRGWHFVITEKYKYIWDSDEGKEWCFDLTNDKLETTNIISTLESGKVSMLRKLMVDNFKARGLDQLVENDQLKVGTRLPSYIKIAN